MPQCFVTPLAGIAGGEGWPEARPGLGPDAAEGGRERLTLTVKEVAAIFGISRAFAYEAVKPGEIPSIRIGRRVLVPRAALEKFA